MSLVKYGAAVADQRGSTGGTTYSRSGAGAYSRQKVSGAQPHTPFVANSRQAFALASQAWAGTLSDSDRAAWSAWATTHPITNVFGDSIILSGISAFVQLSKRLLELGFPIFNTPPVTPPPPAPGILAPSATINATPTMTLQINPTTPTGGGTIIALTYATAEILASRTAKKNQYKLLNDATGMITDETTNWGNVYVKRFTPYIPAAPCKISLNYLYMDTASGQISAPSNASFVIATLPGPQTPIIAAQIISGQAYFFCEHNHGLVTGNGVFVSGGGVPIDLSGSYPSIHYFSDAVFYVPFAHPDLGPFDYPSFVTRTS